MLADKQKRPAVRNARLDDQVRLRLPQQFLNDDDVLGILN